jgi:hypothetical protein
MWRKVAALARGGHIWRWMPLGSFLLQELNRQFERLELLTSQIKELEAERAAAIRF